MDNKTPDNFWNDEFVIEVMKDMQMGAGADKIRDYDYYIKSFKELKLKEQQVEGKRIEIKKFKRVDYVQWSGDDYKAKYQFDITEIIPQEKYEAVSKAIERELNDEPIAPTLERNLNVASETKEIMKSGKYSQVPTGFLKPQDSIEDNKEWEILEYGYRQNNENKPEEKYIYSVRRKKDNCVFTVGERFSNNAGGIYTEEEIKSFYVKGEVMCVRTGVGEDFSHYSLSAIQKLPITEQPKPVLFTTVDGVGIRAHETFWYVGDAWNVCETKLTEDERWTNLVAKSFSTKDLSEQYILDNKPCLSVNEIKLFSEIHGQSEKIQWLKIPLYDLKNLANNKINNK